MSMTVMRPGRTEGFGGGGGGGFAPKPGGGYKVPPIPPGGLANPPMGRPRGFTFPPRRIPPWKPSKGFLDELAKKAAAFDRFKKWAENFLWPDSPMMTSDFFGPGGGWIRCANPTQSCEDTWGPPTDQRNVAGSGSCVAFAPCATGQVYGGTGNVAPGTPAPTTVGRIVYIRQTGTSGSNRVGTFLAHYYRTVPGPDTSVPYKLGRVILPDDFVEPIAEPAERDLTQPRTQPRIDPALKPRPWDQPAVDFEPGTRPKPHAPGKPGTPTVHRPLPPVPPDKEKKPFPGGVPYGAFGKWYGRATEFNDMLDCMAEAAGMPKPKGSPQERAKQVWDRYNDPNQPPPDGNAFAACMALENAKDMAVGRLSRGATRAMNRGPYASKRPGGYRGTGGGTRMHNFGG